MRLSGAASGLVSPRRRWLVAAGLAVAGTLALSACTSSAGSPAPSQSASQLINKPDSTYDGIGLLPPQPRPHFTLTDSVGKPFDFYSQTAGKPTLLYFGYTHCPDVCPATMGDISVALSQVPAAVRDKTQVVFVTTDVKRDTGPVLAKYMSQFDVGLPNKFIGLTGTQNQIDAAQVAAHVTLAEGDGETHSAEVLLYGSDDYANVGFLQTADEQAAIVHDLPLVAG
ncbi:MAG: senC [Frankiales bacterium]|nr:senC [Frankiales bacterium]